MALDPYVHDGPTLIYAALAGTGGGSTQLLLFHPGGALETVAVAWTADMDWATQILVGDEPLEGPSGSGTAAVFEMPPDSLAMIEIF